MFAEKDKNSENGSNFGVAREQNLLISGEVFVKCEIFSWHIHALNTALQFSAPLLNLYNDHSGRYKAIYAQKKHFCPFGG